MRAGVNRVATVRLGELSSFGHDVLSENGFEEVANNTRRRLEDLLQIRPSAYLVFTVLAADGWTGVQHYRESPRYRLDDIREGHYQAEKSGLAARLGALRRLTRPKVRDTRQSWHRASLRRHANLRLAGEGPHVESDDDTT
jgi:hypothetical protein